MDELKKVRLLILKDGRHWLLAKKWSKSKQLPSSTDPMTTKQFTNFELFTNLQVYN